MRFFFNHRLRCSSHASGWFFLHRFTRFAAVDLCPADSISFTFIGVKGLDGGIVSEPNPSADLAEATDLKTRSNFLQLHDLQVTTRLSPSLPPFDTGMKWSI